MVLITLLLASLPSQANINGRALVRCAASLEEADRRGYLANDWKDGKEYVVLTDDNGMPKVHRVIFGSKHYELPLSNVPRKTVARLSGHQGEQLYFNELNGRLIRYETMDEVTQAGSAKQQREEMIEADLRGAVEITLPSKTTPKDVLERLETAVMDSSTVFENRIPKAKDAIAARRLLVSIQNCLETGSTEVTTRFTVLKEKLTAKFPGMRIPSRQKIEGGSKGRL